MRKNAIVIVLMGPMGCGKTTIGRRLSEKLGWPFLDGDDFHPRENVEKMRAGIALNDADRQPWLVKLAQEIQNRLKRRQSSILACSALKQAYRDTLGIDQDTVLGVYLKGSYPLLKERTRQRQHPYMDKQLLRSQLETLETPTDALTVDIAATPEEISQTIIRRLDLKATAGSPETFHAKRRKK